VEREEARELEFVEREVDEWKEEEKRKDTSHEYL